MKASTRAAACVTLLVALAIQAIPVFSIGPPPPFCGKLNVWGWPFLGVTTASHADAAGIVYQDGLLFDSLGVALNSIIAGGLAFLCFASLAWHIFPRFPRMSILDLIAFMAGFALVIAYFSPSFAYPLFEFQGASSVQSVYSTDRPLIANVLCAAMIFLAVHGGVSSLATLRWRNTPVG